MIKPLTRLKQSALLLLAVIPATLWAANEIALTDIYDVKVRGTLTNSDKEFELHINLNPQDKSITRFKLDIGNKPIFINYRQHLDFTGVNLSTLKIQQTIPDKQDDTVWADAPTLVLSFNFQPAATCLTDVGKVRISTDLETLDYSIEEVCTESSLSQR